MGGIGRVDGGVLESALVRVASGMMRRDRTGIGVDSGTGVRRAGVAWQCHVMTRTMMTMMRTRRTRMMTRRRTRMMTRRTRVGAVCWQRPCDLEAPAQPLEPQVQQRLVQRQRQEQLQSVSNDVLSHALVGLLSLSL